MVQVWYEGNNFVVRSPFHGGILEAIKQCPYHEWDVEKKVWSVPASTNIRVLVDKLRLFGTVDLDGKTQQIYDILTNTNDISRRGLIDVDGVVLYPYQEAGVRFLLSKQKAILADEMGLGKTVQSLCAASYLLENNTADFVLVVCPKSVQSQWMDELHKFTKYTGMISCSSKSYREVRYKIFFDISNVSAKRDKQKFLFITYETFIKDYLTLRKLAFNRRMVCICDEASKFNNRNTNVFVTIREVAKDAMYLWFLSGTPMENDLMGYYNLMSIISPYLIKYEEFIDDYCITEMVWTGKEHVNKIIGYRNVEMFAKNISSYVLRREANTVLKLPDMRVETKFYGHSSMQASLFTKLKILMEDNPQPYYITFMRLIDDSPYLLNESKSKYVFDIIEKPITQGHRNEKLQDLQNIVFDNPNKKIVIFTQFKKMIPYIKCVVAPNAFSITGETQDKTVVIAEFEKSDINVLVCTDVLQYGVNMQFCDILVNFDLPWNPAKLWQRIHRIHRIGSNSSKMVITMIGGGIERHVYDVLNRKAGLFNKVMMGMVHVPELTTDDVMKEVFKCRI